MLDNTFQVILIGFFILAAILGVGVFATQPDIFKNNEEVQVNANFSVWGVWSEDDFNRYYSASPLASLETVSISYTSVEKDQIQDRLVNAIARGGGPDVVLLTGGELLGLKDLMTPIPQQFYSVRQYRNSLLEGSEIFLAPDGIQALPTAIDPLVLYWNRDLFTNAGLTAAPKSWSQTATYARQLTRTDNVGNITTAGIGLGSVQNVDAYKQILVTLFFQSGNQIVIRGPDGALQSALNNSNNRSGLASAIELYTDYANPTSKNYSWNNSFSSDTRAFTAGNLGMYLAPASMIRTIRAQNPNLNFDVTSVPSLSGGQVRAQADVYGFGLLKRAPAKGAIVQALLILTGAEANTSLAETTAYTPIHKQVVAEPSADAYQQVFNDAAITGRSWLDPDPEASKQAFRNLITRVISGEESPAGSLIRLSTRLNNLLFSVIQTP